MPFVFKKHNAVKDKKIQQFLLDEAGLSSSVSQKLLAKNRVFDDQGNVLKNGQTLQCEYVQVAVFEGHTRGLKPVFEVEDFAVFDKPSGVMVHPTRKTTAYSLLDEIRHHFGDEADLAHRIDAETSGLVLVAKNKQASTILKTMFEHGKCDKEYLALVKGQLKNNITIDKPISKSNSTIKVKMTCENKKGKVSITHIHPLEFNKKAKAYQSSQALHVELTQDNEKINEVQSDCILCGSCYSACPVYAVNEDFLGPFSLTRVWKYVSDKREEGAEEKINHIQTSGVWDCTLCNECTLVCPQDISSKADIEKLRSKSAMVGYSDPNFASFNSFGGGFGFDGSPSF